MGLTGKESFNVSFQLRQPGLRASPRFGSAFAAFIRARIQAVAALFYRTGRRARRRLMFGRSVNALLLAVGYGLNKKPRSVPSKHFRIPHFSHA